MIDTICREIKNYFTNKDDKHIGTYKISNGVITPSIAIQDGQYYRIIGGVFNEGVHVKGQEDLIDENEFNGAIWLMHPPKAFLELCEDIKVWQNKYGNVNGVAMSPYTSESFGAGGYSYSKDVSAYGDNSVATSWQSMFSSRLLPYRRHFI